MSENNHPEIKSFTEYYHKQIKISYIILVGLSMAVNILDIINLDENSSPPFLLNLFTVLVLAMSLVFFLWKRLSLHVSIGLALYVVLFNLLLSFLFTHRFQSENQLSDFLLRETLFLMLMLIFSGLFLHRIHTLVILGFILFRYISLTTIYQPSFLMENLVTFIITFVALTAVVYFLSGKLHRSIYEIQMKQHEISRQNEELSSKNQSLQDLATAKDKFFSIISHDLKNPLNSLSGFLDLLEMKKDSLPQEKLELYTRNMRISVDQIMELLNDLLEWSRSQSNLIICQPARFRIRDLSEGICYYLKEVADLKGIKINDNTNEKAEGYADFKMLFTVMRNLVSNSIKFCESGKTVCILSDEYNDLIRIKIMDEGVGIEEENISRLFNINTAFSTPGTNREKGTGLGLLVCKEFVEKNGGTIGVESQVGVGSTFWFTFPKQKSDETQ